MQTVGVVGSGILGTGIAQLCTEAGYAVIVIDPDTAPDVSAVAAADIVIEALPSNEEVKAAALTAIGRHVRPDCLIATHSSSLSITRLATNVPRPERFAGLHFFPPPSALRVVEVVRPRLASDATMEALRAFVENIGSSPLMVRDQPGLLVDHLLFPYLNQAIQDYDDGLASAEDIAAAVQLGLGYPMGPLQLADRIGLDVLLQATDNVYAATRERRFAAPPLLRELVAAGQLGNKSGAGLVVGTDR
jgi:3-hydroxybutyryl-CoA dehydrogenase